MWCMYVSQEGYDVLDAWEKSLGMEESREDSVEPRCREEGYGSLG
jgi:hypothetical protein